MRRARVSKGREIGAIRFAIAPYGFNGFNGFNGFYGFYGFYGFVPDQ